MYVYMYWQLEWGIQYVVWLGFDWLDKISFTISHMFSYEDELTLFTCITG
jgi:hypothetical protein